MTFEKKGNIKDKKNNTDIPHSVLSSGAIKELHLLNEVVVKIVLPSPVYIILIR